MTKSKDLKINGIKISVDFFFPVPVSLGYSMEHHGESGNKEEIKSPCHILTGNLPSFGSPLPNNVGGKKKKIQYFKLDFKKQSHLSLFVKSWAALYHILAFDPC